MNISLKTKKEIEGTWWFEFNISGTQDKYEHRADASLFLRDYSFDLFVDAFDFLEDYNHYGPNLYEQAQIRQVKARLEEKLRVIERLKTKEDLIAFLNSFPVHSDIYYHLKDHQVYIEEHFELVIASIKQIALGLLKLTDKCLSEERVLWMLGL